MLTLYRLPFDDKFARPLGAVGGDCGAERAALSPRQPQRFFDEDISSEHALAIGLQRMGFD